jgi:hypothetical protein
MFGASGGGFQHRWVIATSLTVDFKPLRIFLFSFPCSFHFDYVLIPLSSIIISIIILLIPMNGER